MRQETERATRAEAPPRSRPSSNGHGHVRRRRHRRRRHLLGYAAAAVALILVVDAAYVVVSLQASLSRASEQLREASLLFQEGRIERSERPLAGALRDAKAAGDLGKHPSFLIASLLPWLGNDAAALGALGEAARLSARAGLASVEAARAAGATRKGLAASFFSNGRVQFDAIARTRPHLGDVDDLMREAVRVLEAAPRPTFEKVASALATARAEVGAASDSAHRGVVLLEALPGLLGKGSRREYLLAFQTPSEQRGTGGLLGFQGVLESRDGRLRLRHLGPIGELIGEPLRGIEAPGWFERRYRPLSGLRQWQQANMSPDFPIVSEVWLQMYRSATGRKLDGVLAMDPIALSELTGATGPLQVSGLDVSIGPDNAAKVLLHDSYVAFSRDTAAQNSYLAAVVREFWERIGQGNFDAASLARGLAEAGRTQHLKVYARNRQDQQELVDLDIDGGLQSQDPNEQLVYHNNLGVNKVDYFLKRSIDTSVRLTEGGEARVTTTATLQNTAPKGPPSQLLGPGIKGDPAGLNRMLLNFMLPEGATIRGLRVNGQRTHPWRAREAGHPVAWEVVEIPAGETAAVTVTYYVGDAVDRSKDGGEFAMTLIPQTGVRPDQYSVTVVPPYGSRAMSVNGESVADRGSIRVTGALEEVETIEVELARQ